MRKTLAVLVALSLAASLPGCTTAQLRLPEGFGADAEAWDVSGHSPRWFEDPVRFGPYSALWMEEGATFSWAVPLPGFDIGRSSKPFAYTLVANDRPAVEVQCLTRTWTAGTGRGSWRASVDLTALAGPLLACGLQLDGQPPLPLEVGYQGQHMQGRLLAPWGREYAVRELNGYQGTPITSSEPTGYAIADGDTTLAVVDVLNGGRVHFARALDDGQRAYFAATAVALLLLDPDGPAG